MHPLARGIFWMAAVVLVLLWARFVWNTPIRKDMSRNQPAYVLKVGPQSHIRLVDLRGHRSDLPVTLTNVAYKDPSVRAERIFGENWKEDTAWMDGASEIFGMTQLGEAKWYVVLKKSRPKLDEQPALILELFPYEGTYDGFGSQYSVRDGEVVFHSVTAKNEAPSVGRRMTTPPKRRGEVKPSHAEQGGDG